AGVSVEQPEVAFCHGLRPAPRLPSFNVPPALADTGHGSPPPMVPAMNLTPDEARALAFIGGLVFLSAVVRVADRPKPVTGDLPEVDVPALEAASREALESGRRRAEPLAPGEKLDPNRATAAELMRLPRARRQTVD